MPASGDEFVVDGSDDDAPRASTRGRAAARRANARESAQSFEVTRTWDLLIEGADGTITGAVEGLLEAGKRKRLLKDTTPLQRGIIRHLILILDMSLSMNEKDLRPTRYLLTLSYTESFIREFFEQNPISQLGIIGMRDGIALRISDMSGNPNSHLSALQKYRKEEPKGSPSLENALEMARAGLFHSPSHGTREILLVFGALHTSDPGDIHNTINSLVHDKIRATVIGLAAQVAICAELVSRTNDGGAVVDRAADTEDAVVTSYQSELITFRMPSRRLASDQNAGKIERTMPRRLRDHAEKPHTHPNAKLTFDLSNIRRKLNFDSNSLANSQKLAKRQRRDFIECRCHLTIWDNRDGASTLPLVTESSLCRVGRVQNGKDGTYVSIELEEPFIVKVSALKVPTSSHESKPDLEMSTKYFLEVKIIPCTADTEWPPIPIMGDSTGDHFTPDLRKLGVEELQGAIVARYTHLPTAPDRKAPLSVFYLSEGRTYRTKYGLEVISTWHKPEVSPPSSGKQSRGLDMDTFRFQKPKKFILPTRTRKEQPPLPEEATEELEVHYKFSETMVGSTDAAEHFRNTVVRGYGCPICVGWGSNNRLQELLSHLGSVHAEYVFSPSKQRRDRKSKRLTQLEMKVETLTGRKRAENDKAFPSNRGDRRSTGEGGPLQPLFSGNKPFSLSAPVKAAPRYPLASQIPDFRTPMRKKVKAIRLRTMYDEPEHVWTSITNRPVSPSEDPQSETDDEVDNSWQIDLHMENLDNLARQKGWSKSKRELTKRWDRHRMEEQLEHSRYVSNSLIRFARKHRAWLKNGDEELWQVFFDFLADLKETGVIDDNVVSDVNELVFLGPPLPTAHQEQETCENVTDHAEDGTSASEQQESATVKANTRVSDIPRTGVAQDAEPASQSAEAAHPRSVTPADAPSPADEQDKRKQGAVRQQRRPPTEYHCGACLQQIERAHRDTIYCTAENCPSPSTRYHKACAWDQLSAWRRGKFPLDGGVDSPLRDLSPAEELKLKHWACRGCTLMRWMIWRFTGPEEEEEEEEEEQEEVEEPPVPAPRVIPVRPKKREEVPLLRLAAMGSWRQRLRGMEAEEAKAKANAEDNEEGNGKGKEVVRDVVTPGECRTETPNENAPSMPMDNRDGTPFEDRMDLTTWYSSDIAIGNGEGPSGLNRADTRVRERSRTPADDRVVTPGRGRSRTPLGNRPGTPIRKRPGTPIADRMSLPTRVRMRMGSPMRTGNLQSRLKAAGPGLTLKSGSNAQEKAKVAARILAKNGRNGLSNLRFAESVPD
ncbi:hypothetical protein AYO20_11686 [Fonsecaea nubica]|uniref:VWFA domain-containing protein n=1 Tax=Fonsecaea nubica TaxID=856822 RepID=A0A178BN27_9EURO|nr:hypothetical protein AYO20_11686 [Fonsecaea nubica]OAL19050.1 hypothetical protein AYO20_11686 [Fonsecaea nubica]